MECTQVHGKQCLSIYSILNTSNVYLLKKEYIGGNFSNRAPFAQIDCGAMDLGAHSKVHHSEQVKNRLNS